MADGAEWRQLVEVLRTRSSVTEIGRRP
jgi:hypothetical protein